MKENNVTFIILCAMVLIGAYFARTTHGSVPYVETPCPVCGSHEVLDYGLNSDGEQRAYCSDCDLNFNIIPQ